MPATAISKPSLSIIKSETRSAVGVANTVLVLTHSSEVTVSIIQRGFRDCNIAFYQYGSVGSFMSPALWFEAILTEVDNALKKIEGKVDKILLEANLGFPSMDFNIAELMIEQLSKKYLTLPQTNWFASTFCGCFLTPVITDRVGQIVLFSATDSLLRSLERAVDSSKTALTSTDAPQAESTLPKTPKSKIKILSKSGLTVQSLREGLPPLAMPRERSDSSTTVLKTPGSSPASTSSAITSNDTRILAPMKSGRDSVSEFTAVASTLESKPASSFGLDTPSRSANAMLYYRASSLSTGMDKGSLSPHPFSLSDDRAEHKEGSTSLTLKTVIQTSSDGIPISFPLEKISEEKTSDGKVATTEDNVVVP